MKNITLSADDGLIEQARLKAANNKTTLNAEFRAWLERYALANTRGHDYEQLMKRLRHVRSGRRFSRDEMNER